MDDQKEIERLLMEMKSGDENKLIQASVMLGQFGKAAALALVELLKDPRPLVRDYTAMALGIIGRDAAETVPFLLTALADPMDSVRYAVVVALGKIGVKSQAVEKALRVALSDSDPMVAKGAVNSMEELGYTNEN